MTTIDKEKRLLRITDVITRTALSRSHIYVLIRQGRFPAPVKLGPKCARWVESDVDAWLSALTQATCKDSWMDTAFTRQAYHG